MNNSNTTIMHIFDETINESAGLALCSLWIFILPWLNNQAIVEEWEKVK